jgi:hypothetical protein
LFRAGPRPHIFFPPDLFLFVNFVAKGAPQHLLSLGSSLTELGIPYFADAYSCTITSRPIPENSLFHMCFLPLLAQISTQSVRRLVSHTRAQLFLFWNVILDDTLTYILGLDLEMAFKHHYHEVLDTIGDMFTQIFRGLRDRYQVGSSLFTKTVLRIRLFSIPDPDPESASKNLGILTHMI